MNNKITEIQRPTKPFVSIHCVCNVQDIGSVIEKTIATLCNAVPNDNQEEFICWYHEAKCNDTTFDFDCGIVVKDPKNFKNTERISIGSLLGGKFAKMIHYGSYANLHKSWNELKNWAEKHGKMPDKDEYDLMEKYLTDPEIV